MACLPQPSAADVLREVPQYHFLYVFSHGVSDARDPSKSHLIPLKEHPIHSKDPIFADLLTVSDIASTYVGSDAFTAFLTACPTAETHKPTLVDEELQIGNMFQLAGFPHVIATLWSAYGFMCPDFSETFYRSVCRLMEFEPLDNDLVNIATSMAVLSLMKEAMYEPLLWAPFTDMGP
ncbi:hypothetical protein MMC25_005899 [Agyrium rufum]|nr:hypothetical protein [Agyrium rufum]